MNAKKKFLFIILARKGSKRLRGKNLKKLKNKPLIFWAIEQAIRLKKYGDVIVSSNDEKIIQKCSKYNNLTIDRRPDYLSTDKTTSIDVLKYLIKKFKFKGEIILLQPTSPLRSDQDIIKGINLLKLGHKAVMSQSKIHYDASKLGINGEGEKFKSLSKIAFDIFFPNGAFFGANHSWILKNKTFYHSSVTTYNMPIERAIDIDFNYQFMIAETLKKNKS